MKTYDLVLHAGFPGIRCHVCGKTSYHRMDVAQRYCAQCRRFHDDATIYIRVCVDGHWQSAALSSLPESEQRRYIAEVMKDRRNDKAAD